MSHLIFVYGTLKEGCPNFRINTGTRIAGDFQTVEKYPLYLNGERFSACMTSEQGIGYNVRGQLFVVDDAGLARMDELERVTAPDGYRRHQIEVTDCRLFGTGRLKAMAYLIDREFLLDIKSGPHPEYTREHAALYRPRERPQSP